MLLLTRPMEESLRMAKKLEALERPFFIEPMLSVVFMPLHSLDNISTLIVTSQNGLRAIKIPPNTSINIYCVGTSTGLLAKTLGFRHVFVAKNSVHALIALLTQKSPKELGNILYAAGETMTQDLEKTLKHLGYQIMTATVYKMLPATGFSSTLLNLFKEEKIQQVCFFSSNTAEVFMRLMEQHKLTPSYQMMESLSFSKKISSILKNSPWMKIRTAKSPSMNSFWNLLENRVE